MSDRERPMQLDAMVATITNLRAMPDGRQKRGLVAVTHDVILLKVEEGLITKRAGELLLDLLQRPDEETRPEDGPQLEP